MKSEIVVSSTLNDNLKDALTRRELLFMLPLFEGFELNQSDVEFVQRNDISIRTERITLMLKWLDNRKKAVYQKEFLEKIDEMNGKVDDANKQSKTATRNGWIFFAITTVIAIAAVVVSIMT